MEPFPFRWHSHDPLQGRKHLILRDAKTNELELDDPKHPTFSTGALKD